MKIAMASDHRGYKLRQSLASSLINAGYSIKDFGPFSEDAIDYPDFATQVTEAVAKGDFEFGILICGTGAGMCIAANKTNSIRATICRDVTEAQISRQQYDANIMCLGAELVNAEQAFDIAKSFFNTTFDSDKYLQTVKKIDDMERSIQPKLKD